MAVVLASDLAKDMAGEPLLRGVSFKLERRDRMTLSGRNGSGKTTLLRMLSGESGIDGGELVFAKDVRVSLHDQRPPRDRDLTLRDYVLSGCKELLALEEQLARLEGAMADGAMDDATFAAYGDRAGAARARRRLQLARGGQRDAARPRVPRRAPGPLAGDVLGRRADARVAGARAGRRPGPAAARRADQPPRHRRAGVAGGAPADARRRDRAGGARSLVPRGRRHLRARARGRAARSSSRAPGTPGGLEKAQRELALGRMIEKQEAEVAKLERFVTRFRAGTRARQAQSRQKKLDKIERARARPARPQGARASPSSRPSARAASSSRSRTGC